MAETENAELSAEEALEEKAGNFLFGEEPTEETPVVEEPTEEPEEEYEPSPEPVEEGEESLVEVEFNGQIVEAPPEIAEVLQTAESMQSDYTKKTQAVAEERRLAEVAAAEIQHQSQQYAFAASIQDDLTQAQIYDQQIDQARTLLTQQANTLTAPEFQQVQAGIADLEHKKDQLVQSLTTKQQEFQQAQEQSHSELLKKGTEILSQAIPGWGQEQQEQVRNYALSSGFTEAEISGVADPRQVLTLWKAAQYDALKSGSKPALAKVKAAPKVVRRSDAQKKQTSKLALRNQLKSKKLSDADKANLIGQNLKII